MHHRRLARDYETRPHRSAAMIQLAASNLMAHRLTPRDHPPLARGFTQLSACIRRRQTRKNSKGLETSAGSMSTYNVPEKHLVRNTARTGAPSAVVPC